MSQRKCFVVRVVDFERSGFVDKKLWSETKRHAWKAALAKGWLPVKIEEEQEKKAA